MQSNVKNNVKIQYVVLKYSYCEKEQNLALRYNSVRVRGLLRCRITKCCLYRLSDFEMPKSRLSNYELIPVVMFYI